MTNWIPPESAPKDREILAAFTDGHIGLSVWSPGDTAWQTARVAAHEPFVWYERRQYPAGALKVWADVIQETK